MGVSFRSARGVVSTIHIRDLIGIAPRELWAIRLLAASELIQPRNSAMFSFTTP